MKCNYSYLCNICYNRPDQAVPPANIAFAIAFTIPTATVEAIPVNCTLQDMTDIEPFWCGLRKVQCQLERTVAYTLDIYKLTRAGCFSSDFKLQISRFT